MNAHLSELEMLRARLKNERLGFEERELLCRLIIAAEDAQRKPLYRSLEEMDAETDRLLKQCRERLDNARARGDQVAVECLSEFERGLLAGQRVAKTAIRSGPLPASDSKPS